MNCNILMICALSYMSSLWSSVGSSANDEETSWDQLGLLSDSRRMLTYKRWNEHRHREIALSYACWFGQYSWTSCRNMSFAVFSGTCEIGGYKFPFRACGDVLFLLLKQRGNDVTRCTDRLFTLNTLTVHLNKKIISQFKSEYSNLRPKSVVSWSLWKQSVPLCGSHISHSSLCVDVQIVHANTSLFSS